MKVGILAVDGASGFPNLALMKISAWHKANGDSVEWFSPLYSNVEKLYSSKIFTFTKDYEYYPANAEIVKGGTGYDLNVNLPVEIDKMPCDYSIYPKVDYSIGFLSRGCIRNCPWCVVPKKEGYIRQYSTAEKIAQGRKKIVFMDNNFLANDDNFVQEQLEICIKNDYRIDFNQALDCRLVTDENARYLAGCKWIDYIRFSCDTESCLEPLKIAIEKINNAGYKGRFFVYALCREFQESLKRINAIANIDFNRVTVFAMVFRDVTKTEYKPNKMLVRLSNWCNRQALRKAMTFEVYNKNFYRNEVEE